MAILKCKMCGGDLIPIEGSKICECEYCGSKQTIPTIKEEGMQTLFNRANTLRMKAEFDKAADIYEKILQRDEEEAEAYWGLILCKYGIEYVEDPATFKRIPTCHRASYDAVTADEDYKNAIKYADEEQRVLYEEQAKEIEEIQRRIVDLSRKEAPYDVFICYKETDENGKRTPDSVIANDIYYQLTQEGFKVFYSAITLESKLGTEYEPYIFSALNSAKVMLAIGTKPEYFRAVWVKNEWSRFLKLMKKDRSRLLIPCYRDMDPYDLPEEFAHLQAQDMGKIGFINDVVRGIKKVISKDTGLEKKTAYSEQSAAYSSNAAALLKRGSIALEDKEWNKADGFFEEVLNQDPENADAYIGKLLARDKKQNFSSWLIEQKEKYSDFTTEHLIACPEETAYITEQCNKYAVQKYLDAETIRKEFVFDRSYVSALSCRKEQKEKQKSELSSDRLLSRAVQYAKGKTKQSLDEALKEINDVLDGRISEAHSTDMKNVQRIEKAYKEHLAKANKKVAELNADACARQERNYQSAVSLMENASDILSYEKAVSALKAMNGYKDSEALAEKCQNEISRINEEKRLESERLDAIRKKEAELAAKKRRKTIAVVAAAAAVCVAAFFVTTRVIIPNSKYNNAVSMMESGDYEGAMKLFDELDDYKDSRERFTECSIAFLKICNIGDTCRFGSYEQDNNTENGVESIEWIALEKREDSVLLISKYSLDCKPYNIKSTDVTWETCTLRSWLNDTFYLSSFNTFEQSYIQKSIVTADKNPDYNIDPGKDTEDMVFLLSAAEAQKYFESDDQRICKATTYAESQGAFVSEGNSWWWLRSPGSYSKHAASVNDDGFVLTHGNNVDSGKPALRPVIWVKIK